MSENSVKAGRRVLILAATTGYQTRSFAEAAGRLGVDLVFATDRCHQLDDPWQDSAIPVRFHAEDEAVEAIRQEAARHPLHGVVAVGDRPTVIAARVGRVLGLPGHTPEAAAISRNKLETRRALERAGQPIPWFLDAPLDGNPRELAGRLRFPCVVKPLALSGSRGVMRADDGEGFVAAWERLARLLRQKDVMALRDPASDRVVVEEFVEGREFAIEAVLEHGSLHVLAIFDKPDPLDGPFFEETIYVTPSRQPEAVQQAIVAAVAGAVSAVGLQHGPVHAECRVGNGRVVVLEAAARPIGGLCSRALGFRSTSGENASFEELLLRHALGERVGDCRLLEGATGVMMIPIPRKGIYRGVAGETEARAVPGVTEIRITAKIDETLVPLPEGSSYLGFIFARGPEATDVEGALRSAHACLRFEIDPALVVV